MFRVLLVLFGFAGISLLATWHRTSTADEPFHLDYAKQALVDGTFERWSPGATVAHNSKMPVTIPNAAVSVLLDGLSDPPSDQLRLFLERAPTVLWGMLGGLYVFLFALGLFGTRAAWLCLGFYVTEPNLLGHSALITSDVACTALVLASLYHFRAYLLRPDFKRLVVLALAVGLAQVTKYTALILFPLFAVVVLALLVARRVGGTGSRALMPPVPPRRRLLHLAISAAVVIVVIDACFGFEGVLRPLPELAPGSDYASRYGAIGGFVGAVSAAIGDLPVPLPEHYLRGLSMVLADDSGGPGPHVYVLGRLTDHGVPWYFIIVGAFKTPLPLLILAAATAWLLARRRLGGSSDVALFVLLPALVLFLFFSLKLNTQLGVRYVLPIFPLLIVGTVGWFLSTVRDPWRSRATLALLAWQAISSLCFFPHFIPYTNELLLDKKQAYRLFADSNLQWGQDEGALREYALRAADGVHVEPGAAAHGRIVVGVNELVGQSNRLDYFMQDRYAWLRDNFEPVGRLTHSYLIFDVPPETLLSLYDRRVARSEEFPRPMVQRMPPWIRQGEPPPALEARARADDVEGSAVTVDVRITSDAPSRPWNLWFEEVLSDGTRRLASEVHLLEVGRSSPHAAALEVSRTGVGSGTLRGWLGIFPDRFVAGVSVPLE